MLSKRLSFQAKRSRAYVLSISKCPVGLMLIVCFMESLVPVIGSCPVGTTIYGLCARWRSTRPDVLNDLPTAVWLAFEDDDVAAFGGDFSARGNGG